MYSSNITLRYNDLLYIICIPFYTNKDARFINSIIPFGTKEVVTNLGGWEVRMHLSSNTFITATKGKGSTYSLENLKAQAHLLCQLPWTVSQSSAQHLTAKWTRTSDFTVVLFGAILLCSAHKTQVRCTISCFRKIVQLPDSCRSSPEQNINKRLKKNTR